MVGLNKYTLNEQKQRELAQIGSAQVFKNFSRAFHKISLIATIGQESFQKPGNNPVPHSTQGHNDNHNHLLSIFSSSFFLLFLLLLIFPIFPPSFFTCVCFNICARVCIWRKEVLIRCSYQSLYFFFLLRQCLSLNTELTNFTRLATEIPRTPLSPHSTLHSQHQVSRSVPQSYMIVF